MSAPPKSVHITNYYHKNSGGISTSYNALLAAAARHKRPIRLIVPGENEEIEDVNEFGRIYYVPAKKSVAFDKRYRVMMPWQYMLTDSIIRKILLKEKPDLVEITDKYTLSIFGAMVSRNMFKSLGRPAIVHFSCERMDDNIASFIAGGRISRWFARQVMGCYNFPSFDYHIANSPYTAEEFRRSVMKETNRRRPDWFLNFCWRFFRSSLAPVDDRIFICPRGVDADQFSEERKSPEIRKAMIEKAGIPKDSIVLLYAGRISPEKNIGLLAETMKLLSKDEESDFRLLVAGAGPQEDWLRSQAEKHMPGRIKLLGHLDKDTLAGYYANADVFMHPNPKEPFGIAPLEAMASGVPVVVPNAGGLLFYATDENTWLREPEPGAFADAVREIISDPGLRRKKVEAGLKTAAENTRERSTDNLIATYDRILEDFKKRNDLFTDLDRSKKHDFSELVS
ncbi:MAG: glycosyltransferase family 1 protein [Acidobacteria bacterium]|nr:MAG: glycosyltransferase family 1 protein [Acidobacteriota bacterium]REK02615.1 MAG: glycosyltransferase family 1 protein [Acidobacteriota bacterium]REK13582.1 MAG: glycosyltransferase family 1 protein [Acidobacteriota bacterium]REK41576.1 MAG: glycosyltransferase family 1 protein [Acidobacteriota bacterium]